jgi:hypothetical protein
MGRVNQENVNQYDPLIQMGLKFGIDVRTLTGAVTLDRDSPTLLFWDPGGASRAVTLPTAERGLTFIVVNTADALEDLTFAGTVAAGVISQNEAGVLVSDGSTWRLILVGANT